MANKSNKTRQRSSKFKGNKCSKKKVSDVTNGKEKKDVELSTSTLPTKITETQYPRHQYTDGYKTDEGTCSAYCILGNYGIIASRLGNECADQLTKEAITKGDPFFLPKPLSYLKAEIKSAALSIWRDNWDNRETGRSTHDIVPRVSNKPVGWNREELMIVTGHGPFPSYLHRFNLRTRDNCSCGEKGVPKHCTTKCRFTLSWHFQIPTVSFKLQWLKNIFTNYLSRTRLRLLMRFICDENNLIVEDIN
ncbi:hypothetical protein AVEN_109198-1 [Araneus ventricosus]|uniref:Uncharacterized protein n=1 Tax=Araneus ventricosus TaxID=182803 RepID=A0A4Y2QU08_ARAVE|nr:hypothetical protein AVEN_109198-1 [Araneus ventricosus]